MFSFHKQAYFKGDLGVNPDTGKSTVFKEMILGGIRYFCNLIRSAVIPQTFKKGSEASEYGDWGSGGEVRAFGVAGKTVLQDCFFFIL